MLSKLEEKRSLLEDQEIIENAIADRFQRNPELYYNSLKVIGSLYGEGKRQAFNDESDTANNRIYKSKKTRRSRKQIAAQQYEIRLFLDDYYLKQRQINALTRDIEQETLQGVHEVPSVDQFVSSIHTLNQHEVDSEVSSLRYKRNLYAMWSAVPKGAKRTTILSSRAADLDINKVFSRDEQYGGYLDLEPFHKDWINVVKNFDCTLFQFVKKLECFLSDTGYLKQPPMDRKNPRYQAFLVKLSGYIESFFFRKYPLIDSKSVGSVIRRSYDNYVKQPVAESNRGKYFCAVCLKGFQNNNVFESHLTGKHHRELLLKHEAVLIAEYKLHRYLSLLREEYERTKELTERKLAFTADERSEELDRLNRQYNEPTYLEYEREEEAQGGEGEEGNDGTGKGDSGTSLLESSFNMHIGPDGLPIPHWLYKLQGLDVKYTCEICGNEEFQGRKSFKKHFTGPTHQFRLRCLGITPSAAFNWITSIEDAQKLWKEMNESSRLKLGEGHKNQQLEVEVEDRDGNVMGLRVFEELKKQGLA